MECAPGSTAESFDLPVAEMAQLSFVKWDRYAGHPGEFVVYGWIDRPDGRSDFLILLVREGHVVRTITSSVQKSDGITEVIGLPNTFHCQRVELNELAASLPNVVRLETP